MRLITFIIVGISLTISSAAFAKDKLIFSIDLVRHGDRTPYCDLPNSSIKWREDKGELTKEGLKQEKLLGMELRNIYVKQQYLLPAVYAPEIMYVQSTDTHRTIASAKAILDGLYPKSKIPVITVSIQHDSLLIANPGYNIFKLTNRHFMNRRSWNKINDVYKAQLANWIKNSGLPLSNADDLNCLADNLSARLNHQLPLPNGITKQDAKLIISLSDSMILTEFNNYSFPMGDAFLRITDQYIADAINHKSKLKYALFVGHDATLMSVMHALKLPINSIPGYAARLNFAVYENNGIYRTKVTLFI